ncbi:hypothetical protein FNH04_09035 [Streptomyces phyllanthi]|uniref:Uncharacterized protein n=1 Tax=Streptomyces phyllanthi TaxID=1803180 RepID=A0A5N8VXR6_9ACTN|nr:hypothetical protein [Streptomyces phyllanthi]
MLGIYLNDHLAGSTAGVERARYLTRASRGTAIASAMGQIATEIAQDRDMLLELMRRLDVPARQYKILAGWAVEKAGRLKANGRIVRRSPLSTLIELEVLRVGVQGKVAVWQTLRRLSESEDRLDPGLIDDLLDRAHRQLRTLEELHLRQVTETFRTPGRSRTGARG